MNLEERLAYLSEYDFDDRDVIPALHIMPRSLTLGVPLGKNVVNLILVMSSKMSAVYGDILFGPGAKKFYIHYEVYGTTVLPDNALHRVQNDKLEDYIGVVYLDKDNNILTAHCVTDSALRFSNLLSASDIEALAVPDTNHTIQPLSVTKESNAARYFYAGRVAAHEPPFNIVVAFMDNKTFHQLMGHAVLASTFVADNRTSHSPGSIMGVMVVLRYACCPHEIVFTAYDSTLQHSRAVLLRV